MKIEVLKEAPKGVHIFSPSQVKQYLMCPKCWAAYYLDKVKRPTSPAAQKGIAVHEVLEKYLLDGTLPSEDTPEGKIAQPGLIYLPKPGTGSIESKFIVSFDDIYFRGVVDCLYERLGVPCVLDHKTTSNFRYALNEAALLKDLQASIYAAYAMAKEGAQYADLEWVYYKTRNDPESKLVTATMTLTKAKENINNILEHCKEMLDAKAAGKTAEDFEPPEGGCKSFGKCVGSKMTKKKSLSELLGTAGPKSEPKTIEESGPSPSHIESNQAVSRSDSASNYRLYVDCLPRKNDGSQLVQLSTVLKPVFAKIAKEYNVSHYSFIPYGEGRAQFVTLLDQQLSENPLDEGQTILVSLGSPEARDALEVLIEHAKTVVQAIR